MSEHWARTFIAAVVGFGFAAWAAAEQNWLVGAIMAAYGAYVLALGFIFR